MKKILIVTHSYELNTSYSKLTRNLYKLFSKEYDIRIYSTIHHKATIKEPNNYVCTDINKLYDGFIEALNHFKPDLVFTFGDIWTLEFIYQAKIRHIFKWLAYIPVEGQGIPEKHRISSEYELNLKVMLDSIDYKVAYSNFGKNELEKFTEIDTFIYHGVDTLIFQPIKIDKDKFLNSMGIYGNPKTFLYIGDNQYRKGLDLLLESWEKYIQLNPNSLLLLYTSKNSQYGWDLEKLIKEKQFNDTIFFIDGFDKVNMKSDNDLAFLYNLADCYVSTARAEGFGMCLLESLACNTPVICPQFATPAEFVPYDYVCKINKLCNYGKFAANVNWCEVDTNEVASVMFNVKKNTDYSDVIKPLEWKNLKYKWDNAFKEVFKRPVKIGGCL